MYDFFVRAYILQFDLTLFLIVQRHNDDNKMKTKIIEETPSTCIQSCFVLPAISQYIISVLLTSSAWIYF